MNRYKTVLVYKEPINEKETLYTYNVYKTFFLVFNLPVFIWQSNSEEECILKCKEFIENERKRE